MLEENAALVVLFLHWNKIRTQGRLIFNALVENQYLQILDISFNTIASEQTVISMNTFFVENSTIVHLDISYNGWS